MSDLGEGGGRVALLGEEQGGCFEDGFLGQGLALVG